MAANMAANCSATSATAASAFSRWLWISSEMAWA